MKISRTLSRYTIWWIIWKWKVFVGIMFTHHQKTRWAETCYQYTVHVIQKLCVILLLGILQEIWIYLLNTVCRVGFFLAFYWYNKTYCILCLVFKSPHHGHNMLPLPSSLTSVTTTPLSSVLILFRFVFCPSSFLFLSDHGQPSLSIFSKLEKTSAYTCNYLISLLRT